MPGYPWLEQTELDPEIIQAKMEALRSLGAPYTDEQIDNAPAEIAAKTEMDAVIAYLQGLGTAVKIRR